MGWKGTDPRGLYIPAIGAQPGTASSGEWKNFSDGMENVYNKTWRDDAINLKTDYEAAGDGVTDDTSEIQSAIDAGIAAGKPVYVPEGDYLVTSTLDVTQLFSIFGGDQRTSVFHYNATDGTSLFKIDNSGSVAYNVSFRRLGFDADSTATGCGIEVIDGSSILFQDLYFRDWDATATTKCIWTKGREFMQFKNIRIADATIGVHLDGNPNHATIDVDGFHFEDCLFDISDTTNGYGILGDADYYYSLTSSGSNHIVNSKHGIYLNADGASSSCQNISLRNWRTEGLPSGGWAIHISTADTIVGLLLENISQSENAANGIYLRNCLNATLLNNIILSTAGATSFDTDAASIPLIMIGNFNYSTATENIASDLLFSSQKNEADSWLRMYDDGKLFRFGKSVGGPAGVALTYGPSITTNSLNGNYFKVTITDGNAFTMNSPTNSTEGHRILYHFYNNSGGAHGAITWGANFELDSNTGPAIANGQHELIEFIYDGAKWRETSRAVDIPN